MRIWLKKTCAGPQGSFLGEREYAVPGEMPEDLAKALVAAKCGRWVEAPVEPETAEVVETATEEPAPENAAERTKPPKKKAPKKARGRSKRSAG